METLEIQEHFHLWRGIRIFATIHITCLAVDTLLCLSYLFNTAKPEGGEESHATPTLIVRVAKWAWLQYGWIEEERYCWNICAEQVRRVGDYWEECVFGVAIGTKSRVEVARRYCYSPWLLTLVLSQLPSTSGRAECRVEQEPQTPLHNKIKEERKKNVLYCLEICSRRQTIKRFRYF